VTPEQAEKISVAAELGRLSLTLRGRGNATDQTIATSITDRHRTMVIKPTWAGDVSPALDRIFTSDKVVAAQRSAVEVIHGSKREIVKPE
jgi:Flp pilus assembly protein CpaB